MNIIPADTYEYSQRFWKVLKTNRSLDFANKIIHEMFDNDNYDILDEEGIDIAQEFATYREIRAKSGNYGITQLSLPSRFGIYKAKKTSQKETMDVELEMPEPQESSDENPMELEPDHKKRSIFK